MKKSKRIKKDEKILTTFIKVYCEQNHIKNGQKEFKNGLCQECYELLEYAKRKNEKCPLDPKPQCKHCKIHCYSPKMRQKIKEVMKFSGIYMIKHGRLDMIFHYFF